MLGLTMWYLIKFWWNRSIINFHKIYINLKFISIKYNQLMLYSNITHLQSLCSLRLFYSYIIFKNRPPLGLKLSLTLCMMCECQIPFFVTSIHLKVKQLLYETIHSQCFFRFDSLKKKSQIFLAFTSVTWTHLIPCFKNFMNFRKWLIIVWNL